jgi:hypothetical protein
VPDVRVNSPPKSGPKPRMPAASFCCLFCYESVSNTFDRDRPSRLRDAVTLGRSSLYIRAAATEIGIDQQPRKHQHIYRFRRYCCYAAEATSSHSSTYICDRESRSPKPSSSAILHRERPNKGFGKQSLRLLARFIKFFTTAHLPLRRSHAEGRRLQRKVRHADRRLHPVVIVKEPQVTYRSCSQIMSYIFNMLIFVGMILLDNLL